MDETFAEVLVGTRVDVLMAEELLRNNGIQCMVKPRMGAGFVMRAGDLMESYTLLVRDGDAQAAHALVAAFLTGRGQLAEKEAADEPDEAEQARDRAHDAEMEAYTLLEDMEEMEEMEGDGE